MRTGYWLEYNGDWAATLGYANGDVRYNLLHGYCLTFAYALRQQFGYPVLGAFAYDSKNDELGLVHAFCEGPDGTFVDVRGATDDFAVLMEEFEDEFSSLDELDVQSIDSAFDSDDMLAAACDIIETKPEAYSLR